MEMTYQEAIEAIKANYPDERYTVLRDALDMAMDALKAQEQIIRCKDCAYRDYDNCPMEFYFDCHPADDECYCAYGKRKEQKEMKCDA